MKFSCESGAAIRYVKHFVDTDGVRRHIQQRKPCPRPAMTLPCRISFALTDGLDISCVSPLTGNAGWRANHSAEQPWEAQAGPFGREANDEVAIRPA
nr:recombination-associated protein RdgC [Achromobacter aloeverae]